MITGIERMYDGNVIEDVVTQKTERRLKYSFATKDEAEGFLIKLDREPRQTRGGTLALTVLEADLDNKVVTVLATTSKSMPGGLANKRPSVTRESAQG